MISPLSPPSKLYFSMLGRTRRRWELYSYEKGFMPRIPLHALTWSGEHSRYELYTQGHLEQTFMPVDVDVWLNWLEQASSFAFRGACGSLNVYREERPRGGQYWYAYTAATSNGTRKRYLGRTARVTFATLEEAAKALGNKSSPIPLTSEHVDDERDGASPQASSVPAQEVSHGMELLATRLSHPVLSPRLLAREHLLHRLDAAHLHRMTLLSASAGWGKTTLLAAWAARLTVPFAWLSLDELDNDPARFWVSILTSLRARLPGVGEAALSMLRSPQSPPLSTILTTLLNDLSSHDTPIFLLLDDYHLIDEQAIHDSLLFVLGHLPAHLHLVLASRVDPPLMLSRWRVRGQLLELRDIDLRFAEEESARFLTHTMDLPLEATEIAELARRTGGWVASLQLAALSLVHHPDRAAFVQGFSGGHRYILDYVQEDILAHLSPSLQDFVLSTSILNRMSASLCEAVTAQAASQEMLETIERANLFLVPLDDERKWYRFHDLFREALLARLQATRPETIPLFHQRAARWYEERGEFREAVSHWLAAKDFSSAVRLMKQTAEQFWLRGEAATMYHWIMALPDAVVREYAGFVLTAALYLINAAAHTVEAQITQSHQQAKQMMARVEHTALLGDRGAEIGPQADMECLDTERARLRRRLQLLHLEIEMDEIELSGNYDRFPLVVQRIQQLDQDDEMIWQMLPLFATFVFYFSYQNQAALVPPQFLEARQRVDLSGDRFAMIKIRQWLALISWQAGLLRQAHQVSLEGLALLEQSGGYDLLAGYFATYLACVYYHWNQLDEARLVLHKTIPTAVAWQQLDLQRVGYGSLADVELAARDVDATHQALQSLEDLTQLPGLTLLKAQAQALRVQWFLLQGDLDRASNLAAQITVSQDIPDFHHDAKYFSLIRVYLAQERFSQALEMLERVSRYFDQPGNNSKTCTFLSLYVVALYQAGKEEQARAIATRLLALTEAEGYIRLYLDAGEPMRQVLKALLTTQQDEEKNTPPIPRAYILTLLTAFEQEEQRFALKGDAPQAARSPGQEAQAPAESGLPGLMSGMPVPVEALTPQEQRVLRLLVAGRSNQEIAQALTVSLNTVKTHVKNLYSKLHVTSRMQASALARDLQLL